MRGALDEVSEVRAFNRFFTRRIGTLQEGLLKSPYTLTEARILFEVGNGEGLTASHLSRELGLDPGYLSRLLAGLREQALISTLPDQSDGRRRIVTLTGEGRQAFELLDGRSRQEIGELLDELSSQDRARLLGAMRDIEDVLKESRPRYSEPYYLRPPESGDLGWISHRHGVLYAAGYGWDASFEALVCEIVADFGESHDPEKERCWIAEMGGRVVGSVLLVRESEKVAKLRLLLVEPEARGLGLGHRLVQECIDFARDAGYETLTLWTNSVLRAAIHIYEAKGFVLKDEEEHHSFGKDLTGQNWELKL